MCRILDGECRQELAAKTMLKVLVLAQLEHDP
jgi:hypothetical protein